MTIQGSLERMLDSVLPHEVTHTIFATHFRQPLPRWADEGACTTVEHVSERAKAAMMLIEFLRTGRGIAFNQMFAMKEYPHDVMPLYSQGYSLARYLVAQGGKRKFLDFLADGLRDENWTRATQNALRHRQPGGAANTAGSTGSARAARRRRDRDAPALVACRIVARRSSRSADRGKARPRRRARVADAQATAALAAADDTRERL